MCWCVPFVQHPYILDLSQLALVGNLVINEEARPITIPIQVCFTLGTTFNQTEGIFPSVLALYVFKKPILPDITLRVKDRIARERVSVHMVLLVEVA